MTQTTNFPKYAGDFLPDINKQRSIGEDSVRWNTAFFKTGTFTANGTSGVTVADARITATSIIIPTLKTVGGTVGAVPAVKTITPGTGFTVAATASDTSIYNYIVLG